MNAQTDRDRARFICHCELHLRLSLDPVPKTWACMVPDGFDVHGVVWSVSVGKLPKDSTFTQKLERNTRAYAQLRTIFDEEYASYEKERSRNG